MSSHMSKGSTTGKLSRVERFFSTDVETFKKRLRQLDKEIDSDAVPQRDDDYHRRVSEAFDESQEACRRFEEENGDDPQLILDAQEGFRKETDQWFSRSWIGNHARTKPSGFAGDFAMLMTLYRESTSARGLGGYLDLHLMDLPLAQAVRTRLLSTRDFLIREITSRKTDVRVLDIACGPCREYQDWPMNCNGKKLEIVAMDSDPAALEYVEKNVVGQLSDSTQLSPVRYNALRTRSASATIRKFGKFDIVYSVGLCDYLSDEHLIKMLSAWRDTLNEGGVLLIAFKDCERYDKTPYQWHLDWFFFQRTRQDVLDLYRAAGFDVEMMKMTRDGTRIIVNYIDRRDTSQIRRMDVAGGINDRIGGNPSVNSPTTPK